MNLRPPARLSSGRPLWLPLGEIYSASWRESPAATKVITFSREPETGRAGEPWLLESSLHARHSVTSPIQGADKQQEQPGSAPPTDWHHAFPRHPHCLLRPCFLKTGSQGHKSHMETTDQGRTSGHTHWGAEAPLSTTYYRDASTARMPARSGGQCQDSQGSRGQSQSRLNPIPGSKPSPMT